MDLTPTDVENREFPEGRRGYVREEVDRFLDNVAAQFRRYDERLAAMGQRITQLESELAHSRETEEMSRRMLLVAQRTSEETVAEAEARAKALLADSQAKAAAALAEAQSRAAALDDDVRLRRAGLEADIEALKRFEAEYRAQLRQALEGHLAALQRSGRSSSDERPAPRAAEEAARPAASVHPPAGTPRPAPLSPNRPPPVRVADNEVLRRLTEATRTDESNDR